MNLIKFSSYPIPMYGKCDICKKESKLIRTTFTYDVQCLCHSPSHFDLYLHCEKCTPNTPTETKIIVPVTNKLDQEPAIPKHDVRGEIDDETN